MRDPFDVTGKVIVVTGAQRGIGRGVADYFCERGAEVVALVRSEARAEEFKKELKELGQKMNVAVLDTSKVEDIQPAFDKIVEQFGRIDVLVNNVGWAVVKPAIEYTAEEFEKSMNTNLRGTFFCAQAAAKHMLKAGYGRIVNISSQAGLVGIVDEAVYCSCKGFVNQLTKALSLEWSKHGVTVNAVAPTFTYTPSTKTRLEDPEFGASILARIPRGKFGTIPDVASAINYLIGENSDMLSGSIIVLDGGWTIV